MSRQKDPRTAKLNPILNGYQQIKTEEMKRPDHPDFMTASELKKLKINGVEIGFTGLRENRIEEKFELWITGEIVDSVTFEQTRANPFAVASMQADYFQPKGN
ncbi:hypothetical protein Tiera_025 [Polaromonas phage Tiera]|nr:hypothetical protein Tiera_025 [Polaromonas phage Tiera]